MSFQPLGHTRDGKQAAKASEEHKQEMLRTQPKSQLADIYLGSDPAEHPAPSLRFEGQVRRRSRRLARWHICKSTEGGLSALREIWREKLTRKEKVQGDKSPRVLGSVAISLGSSPGLPGH